jgi:DNA polymerase III delta' subunit
MRQPPVIGHENVRDALRTALDGDRLPHALLFAGPAGVGKSLVARHLAASLLCAAVEGRPCGSCARCVQLAAGTHPDFVPIELAEGKKEIGVDAIRRLKRRMALRATAGAHKVAVIDDAERLSIAAQNALLKTLEEPPPGSHLVLVTASPRALLPTVRSRCRLVTFRPLTAAQVEAALRESGLPAAEAAELAAAAEGSPGYALQLRGVLASCPARDLDALLADLDPDRYVTVIRLAKALGRTEDEMLTRMQVLYARLHAAAVRAVRRDQEPDAIDSDADQLAERATRQAAVLAAMIAALQRRNPNRPLLAEAAALRLARS